MRCAAGITLCALAAMSAAAGVEVHAAVESGEVYLGETFRLQVQVTGSAQATAEVPRVRGARVEFIDLHNTSNKIQIIINGRQQVQERIGCMLEYRVTPTSLGRLVVPPIQVHVAGKTYETRPVAVNVTEAPTIEGLSLDITVTPSRCYVGEPVILTGTAILPQETASARLHVPAFESDAFHLDNPAAAPWHNPQMIAIGSIEAIGVRQRIRQGGELRTQLLFQKALLPRRDGIIQLPPSTLSADIVTGRGRRSPFDGFFGPSPFSRTETATFAAQSEPFRLEVLPLPEEGKPADFSGLVGQDYQIQTDLHPREANVGDPLTLTIRVYGPNYLGNITAPRLDRQPAITQRFRVPEEMAPGEIRDNAMVFTQTIRPLSENVGALPPVRLCYFDKTDKTYRAAESEPIPLAVRPTTVVTAEDAEGAAVPQRRTRLERLREGIAHNYEDTAVLRNAAAGLLASTGGMVVLGGLPAGLFVLSGLARLFKVRKGDRTAAQRRKAAGRFRRDLAAARHAGAPEVLLDILRAYLGAKLGRPAAALTAVDAAAGLRNGGASAETAQSVRRVMEACEASRYAGGAATAGGDGLYDAAQRAVEAVEREVRP